jgi:tetratricopeptide (TPR) repeat protein
MRTLLLFLICAAPLAACLWDYDTLAQESAGMPDVKAAIVGGFPRNPPLYYEMRLERVTKLLADNPDDLDAYDAAGVACDRLGRADEAIAWMARKLEAMERMGYDGAKHAQPNHRYRYLANLGTFHAHRWFKNGADRSDMTDMQRGRELIAQAITDNPNAHFGREKYQLMAMDWIYSLDPDKPPATYEEKMKRQTFLGIAPNQERVVDSDKSLLTGYNLADAIDGISGLIIMGNAWESVDAYKALALALSLDGRTLLAQLADWRARELGLSGRDTVVPRTWLPRDDDEEVYEENWRNLSGHSTGETRTDLVSEYPKLREIAEDWHSRRATYMLERLERGWHPDTRDNFWAEFAGDPNRMPIEEPGAITLAVDWVGGHFLRPGGPAYIALAAAAVLTPTLAIILIYRRRRRAVRT